MIVVWLRRDLRLRDNAALAAAAQTGDPMALAFVVAPALLAAPSIGAPIVVSFFSALTALREELLALGSDLALLEGDFESELVRFMHATQARALYYNEDYEPDARARDERVTRTLTKAGIEVRSFSDLAYFAPSEIASNDGSPYRVYGAYRRRWVAARREGARAPLRSFGLLRPNLVPGDAIPRNRTIPKPEAFGFATSRAFASTSEAGARAALSSFLSHDAQRYEQARDFPALDATSHLSPHLRAGTIGIRTCVEAAARAGAWKWLDELIWREFYFMLLARFPQIATCGLREDHPIAWRNDATAFAAWRAGVTGYPIVDAGMRQLNETGWMHNRLRMIVASFLTKHLLIDWRAGAHYFERHLSDADLAQNNGGWQWASSVGSDAVPYFRIFNPTTQAKRIDADGSFVRRWIPELRDVPNEFVHEPWRMPPLLQSSMNLRIGRHYPSPIVALDEARARALAVFSAARSARARP